MEDEISAPAEPASSSASSSKPRNACILSNFSYSNAPADQLPPVSELMSAKRKAPESPPSKSKRSANNPSFFNGRDGLGQYINNPKKYDPSVVVYFNDSFVAINDLYPKSSVHCLLLPRSANHTDLHPFDAFDDAEFLAAVRVEAQKLKVLVAKELQRKFGPVSKQDEAREAVLNGEVEAEELPEGRDWEKEVNVGVFGVSHA
ncbi:hypothetical protein D0Z07_5027 [Hyphodiscus hymeniophilus]|uniref:HIT domain-containing protein n=1 Tax=Hyphodiscus hymeniophilus TaxID=353542 RepID=A0A9P7AXC4_9HELO|nr:hypothetical protein D0Z07_5027 [Hyphodiscus hymeniophilus]